MNKTSTGILTLIFTMISGGPVHRSQALAADRASKADPVRTYMSDPTTLSNPVAPPAKDGGGPSCDSLCDEFVHNSNGRYVIKGLTTGKNWETGADDQECARYGYATDSSLYPNQNPPAEIKTPEDKRKVEQCIWMNTQMGINCQAYAAAKNTGTAETIIMAVDFAAASICTTACLTTVISAGATETACQVAGGAAALSEIYGLISLNKGFSKRQGFRIKDDEPEELNGRSAGQTMGDLARGGIAIGGGTMAVTGGAGFDGISKIGSKKQQACIAAGAFAALGGIRLVNLMNISKVEKKSCENVQSLWSNSHSANGLNTTVAGNSNNPTSSSTHGGGRGNGGITSGISSSVTPGGPTAEWGNVLKEHMAATDAGVLLQSPLGELALEHAGGVNPQQILRDINDGMNPSAAIGAALGGSPVAQEIAAIAGESGSSLKDFKLGGVQGSSYAQGSGSAQSSHANESFGGFGGGRAPALGAQTNDMVFKGNRTLANDIWHTGTDKNIFQIVSGKIESVTPQMVKK